MGHHQNAAAGDEAVGYIEYGKFHKGCFDHIHHIAHPDPVDHVTQAAAVDGCDAPPFEGGKAHGFFEIFIEDQPGENSKDQSRK